MYTITNCLDGKHNIEWRHLVKLYHDCRPSVTSPGLTILPKLKYEHISLTSFSKMRVDLAAQVSYTSIVANSFTHGT